MKNQRQTVLITGVSSGIGYDAVRFLLEKGYYVIGSVRKQEDKIKLEADFTENFTCLQFDVTKKEQIIASLEQVESILNGHPLSGLINNAGQAIGGPMQLLSDDKFRQQIEINLFGTRNVTNCFLPLLGAINNFQGTPGKIINISSLAGIFNTPFLGAYCVSKHAMESLGEIYRRELLLYGIDVVSIQSGPIASQIWKKNREELDEFADSDYAAILKKSKTVMRKAEKEALPARVISELICKILAKKRPKLSYIVHKHKLKTILLTKYLPARLIDRMIKKSFQSTRSRLAISGRS
jgi:short-subunit dehydrogenase